jgi:glutamate/tyrosine decarboxylase-like PLP-dependent enzyme
MPMDVSASSQLDTERTLDPDDWQAFRALGHRMVDDMLDHLASLRQQPVWRRMPPGVVAAFQPAPPPFEGIGAERAYAEFVHNILPYPNGNLHPRHWGWVQGNGTPLGMFADMLAAGLNPHVAGFNQAPALVERQVIGWFATLLGMPAGTGGVLVTGGTIANILGLNVARHAKAGFDVREEGLQGERARLVCYASSETHGWLQKGVELLGLGNRAWRRVPVDAEFRIDLRALRRIIAEDRAAGHRPFCVVGTAGTVNTGAIDGLDSLADVAREEDLWFHVDGAFGALAHLPESLRPLVRGLGRADSIGFDLHKWFYLPFGVACVLVRDDEAQRAAFATSPDYLRREARGVIAGGLPFADRGIDLSRPFWALKVWMSLKAHGVAAFADLVEQNCRQAQYLAAQVTAAPDLELMAPVSLNIVCFRFVDRLLSAAELDALNAELLVCLQEAGVAVLSGTRIEGRYALRCAITNHRSRSDDFDLLLAESRRIGRELLA